MTKINYWYKTWWGIPLMMVIFILFIMLFFALTKNCNCPEFSKLELAEKSSDCPEFNCTSCPTKIEYQTKEVENKIYIDKPIYKYVCFDNEIKSNIEDCENIKSYIESNKNKATESFCAKPENKNYEKVFIKNAFESNRFLDKSNLYKYYPSLNEGWIYYYPIYIENAGCTKLEMDNFSSKSNVYLNNKLIHSYESEIYSVTDYVYPEDDQMYNIALASYDDFNDNLILIAGADQGPIKITSAGNYIVRVSIYYNNIKIADIEDIIVIN